MKVQLTVRCVDGEVISSRAEDGSEDDVMAIKALIETVIHGDSGYLSFESDDGWHCIAGTRVQRVRVSVEDPSSSGEAILGSPA